AERAAEAARAAVEREAARPFFEEHLPAPRLAEGPRGLLWWQWLALPALVVLAIVLGAALGWLTRRVLGHLAAKTRTTWDDVLLERIAAPLSALWAIAIVTALQPWLVLPEGPALVLHRVLRAATYLAVFWAGFRSVNVAFAVMSGAPWTRANASLAGLLPVGRKVAKVVLLALGGVAVLNELGFQVASLLAGLGIGGIAIALAAQKTVENVFGSLSIGVDQPFRVGDFVKIEDFVGTVEHIGMRSTRVRTLDRTIITIPNGKLSDMRTETFAPRDRIRLLANFGLVYSTSAAQMREVLAGIERALRTQPKLWTESVSVRFSALGDSALNVEVVAWFETSDFSEFTAIRQELFLSFMEAVERAGTSFAFPTRTLHLVPPGGAGQPRGGHTSGERG
ncbi:MAG TPA: mechanosensitive ion channel family protein, partial [Anaeromyxobacter sp.]|nr:mechanosensitive ion channel family protein [Anaeromyxobacter sp.]